MRLKFKMLVCAALMLFPLLANATLIGDSVNVSHVFPSLSNSIMPASNSLTTTVIAGTSDTLIPLGTQRFPTYTVNVEANNILIDNRTPNWRRDGEFNGVFIDSLNDSSGNALSGVIVDTNISNWSDARLGFDADSIWINFGLGASIIPGYINLFLEFGNINTVPEPSSLLLLMASLIALGVYRKFRSIHIS